MKAPVVSSIVQKVSHNRSTTQEDFLAVEEPLEIQLVFGPDDDRQRESISVTMRTPGNDEELALGFLFSEGIISSPSEVLRMTTADPDGNIVGVELVSGKAVDPGVMKRNFITNSSCGVCGKSSIDAVLANVTIDLQNSLRISPAIIDCLPERVKKQQSTFAHTGGIHAAALVDTNGTILAVREDVGRHNALDKLIGASLNQNLPLTNSLIVLSGRASFELIQKAATAGVQLVAAVGAPSSLAVTFANACDMTLVGFIRDQRFNIYCGQERVTI